MRKLYAMILVCAALALSGCNTTRSSERQEQKAQRVEVHTQLATNYMRRGQFVVAEKELEKALALDPGSREANFAMATLKNSQHLDREAARYYRKAAKHAPTDSPIRLEYGAFLCRHGDPGKAIAQIRGVLDTPSYRPNGQAWFRLGECHFVQHDYAQAEKALRQTLSIDKNMAPALMLMARIKYDQKNYLSARAYVERYLALGRPNPRILLLGARTERALGDMKTASQYKGQLLELFPSSAEVRMLEQTGM